MCEVAGVRVEIVMEKAVGCYRSWWKEKIEWRSVAGLKGRMQIEQMGEGDAGDEEDRFLVPSPGTTTTELLRLASPGISDEQGPVVLPQNVLDLLLRLLVHVLLVESHQCLGDALTNGVDLRGVTSSLDTDPHVHAGETDRLHRLEPEDLGFNQLDRGAVDLDQTASALTVSNCYRSLLASEALDGLLWGCGRHGWRWVCSLSRSREV
ncbi:hypothetical protein F8388_001787 [Cannabis sativa]|uniref:Uncharacterized protein n=1 Tax=Cannabis sativa TaxID=3483 RepID=A0A7J6F581_CANSA|nr:hypothetical protein F8388_001787 [Cannabis sativa]